MVRALFRHRSEVGLLRRHCHALRSLGIAKFRREKIYDLDFFSVFHFAFADMIKMRPPMFELLEIFGHPLGEQDVIGIAAFHYPLRCVDTRARDIGAAAYIHYPADRPAMHAHAQAQV